MTLVEGTLSIFQKSTLTTILIPGNGIVSVSGYFSTPVFSRVLSHPSDHLMMSSVKMDVKLNKQLIKMVTLSRYDEAEMSVICTRQCLIKAISYVLH